MLVFPVRQTQFSQISSQFLSELRQSTTGVLHGDVIKVIWQLRLGAARPGFVQREGHRPPIAQLWERGGLDTGLGVICHRQRLAANEGQRVGIEDDSL